MIVWMASWPRCGSTLFRIALHTYTGLPTYSYANDPLLNRRRSVQQAVGQRRLPTSLMSMGPYHKAPRYYFIKVHLHHAHVKKIGSDIPAVLIVRDVRDAVVSLAHYTTWRRGRKFAPELARIITNEGWKYFVGGWLEATDVIVRYEDLLTAPQETLLQAFRGLELDIRLGEHAKMPTFQALHSHLPAFFRKGKTGGWRTELTDKQEAQIWEANREMMERLGYERGRE